MISNKICGKKVPPLSNFPMVTLRQENWLFIYQKKNGKIIVWVTVNSVVPLQKNTSQSQAFGEMKLKIKKWRKKKQYAVKALKKTKICIVYQSNAEEGDAVWEELHSGEVRSGALFSQIKQWYTKKWKKVRRRKIIMLCFY